MENKIKSIKIYILQSTHNTRTQVDILKCKYIIFYFLKWECSKQ